MKFTKEDARKDLMSKIPNKGQTLNLSERSISEQLDTLIPLIVTDDTELDEFVERVLPIFKTADANVKNDVSVGIQDYQKKNPVKPKPNDDDDSKVKGGEDEVSKALLARIEELEKKNAENERRSQLSLRRSEVVAKMKDKGVKDKEWINSFLDEVSLDGEEFDIDAKVDSYVKMYNKSLAIVDPSITPKDARGGGGEDKELAELIKGASNFVKSQRLDSE